MKTSDFLELCLSLPKSLWVSFHYFSWRKALRLPILVRYNTSIKYLQGKIILSNDFADIKKPIIKFGFGHVGVFDKRYERSIWEVSGCIKVVGRVEMGHGSRLCVVHEGVLQFGKNFINTAKMTLICTDNITFGNDVLTSWNTLIMDTDWHNTQTVSTGELRPCHRPITFGNHIWIGTRAVILKGTQIADGTIIGAGAIVTGKHGKPNVILAGNPAKEVKDDITREY